MADLTILLLPNSLHSLFWQVHITIRDLDDNKPTFVKKEMSTGVRVDAALQTEVLKLRAEDKDPTALPIRSVLGFYHILLNIFM